MRVDSINMQIQELIDATLRQTLLSSLTTYLLFSIMLCSLIIGIYYLTHNKENKDEKKKINIKGLLVIISSITIMSGISYIMVSKDYKEKKSELDKYKTTYQFSDGRKKLNTPYWNYDLEVELDKYISELPLNKTKNYTDFHYNDEGAVEFYFNGELRTMKNPELLTIIENKKPILIYQEIDKDIYGIYKKGDIVNIQFITNY